MEFHADFQEEKQDKRTKVRGTETSLTVRPEQLVHSAYGLLWVSEAIKLGSIECKQRGVICQRAPFRRSLLIAALWNWRYQENRDQQRVVRRRGLSAVSNVSIFSHTYCQPQFTMCNHLRWYFVVSPSDGRQTLVATFNVNSFPHYWRHIIILAVLFV